MIALGSIIYMRVSTLNIEQFYEKLNQTLSLMDTTMGNHFRAIATSVDLFGDTEIARERNDSIKSYVNLSDPSGKIPMTPLTNSPYEAEVYKLAKAFVEDKPELLGVSLSLQSTGAFTRFPAVARSNGYDSRTRSWFKDAVKGSGKVQFSDAYTTSAGETVIVASRTVSYPDGSLKGVVTADADLSNLTGLFNSISGSNYTTTSVILCDHNGSILVDTVHPDNLFKKIGEIGIKGLENYGMGDSIAFSEVIEGKKCEVRAVVSNNGVIPLHYILIVPDSELRASNKAIVKTLLTLLVIALIASIIVAHVFGRQFVRPIIEITDVLKNISDGDGDLTQRLPKLASNEIGQLSEHFNNVMQKLSTPLSSIKDESVVMEKIGKQLASDMSETAGATVQISSNIESMKHRMQEQSAGAEETSSTMRNIAEGIRRLNTDIDSQSKSVSQQSTSLKYRQPLKTRFRRFYSQKASF
ncbi:MAG: methyl-accepting chemotaxis protein [Treponema sp.]|nr:methyl-accepting chemotaxis protein [Treponema sp.]